MGILSLLSLILLVSAPFADASEKPNIVFILADDVGFGGLACYGHPHAKTPHIDSLAKDGTRFTRYYATGGTCQPSRVGFMTSRHPRSFERRVGDYGFDGRPTVTELLNNNGYATGHFGKWHIGPGVGGGKASERVPPASDYGIDAIRALESVKDRTKGRDDNTFEAAIDFIERQELREVLDGFGDAQEVLSSDPELMSRYIDHVRLMGELEAAKWLAGATGGAG